MALPIKAKPGHVIRRQALNKYGSIGYSFEDIVSNRFVQSLPYDRPLPYSRYTRYIEVVYNPDNYWVQTLRQPNYASQEAGLYSRTYAKFVNKALQGGRAELGMNIATAKMTKGLLVNSLHGLTRMEYLGGIADRHGRFCDVLRNAVHEPNPRKRQKWRNRAARLLGVAPTSQKMVDVYLRRERLRKGARSFSSEYLAFHYGWSPLISDFFTVLSQIQDGYTENPVPIKETARVRWIEDKTSSVSGGRNLLRCRTTSSCQIGAVAQVNDRILFVMNRTGLINPATVVWDRVPFSFVADWFGNIGQMLASPMDLIGVSVKNCWITYYHDWTYTDQIISKSLPSRLMRTHGISVVRTTSSKPPLPSFVLKNPFGESWRRAFAQISLLARFGLGKSTRS